MARQARLGVLGLGRMGRLYARMLARQVPNAELVAVADPDPAARAAVREELGDIRSTAEPRDLLELPSLDGVVIATPTSTHAALVAAAAEAGKAILCEKPLALTLPDTRAILHAVDRAGVLLQVGFMRRFDAAYRRARSLIDDGQIGRPITFKGIARDPFCPPPGYADPAVSGGLIVDMGIHDFDLARWLMGSEVESVTAEGSVLLCDELRDLGDIDCALVNLRFASGALGNVEVSRNARYGYDIRTEVVGTDGALAIGGYQNTPVVLLTRAGAQHDVVPYLLERFGEAYRAQLQHFVGCLIEGRKPDVTGADGLAAFEIGLAARQAYESGRAVSLRGLATTTKT